MARAGRAVGARLGRRALEAGCFRVDLLECTLGVAVSDVPISMALAVG